MNEQFGILFTSRNNYELLDQWCSCIDTEGYYILNIDEDSTDEQKELGKEVCKKHNITYRDREERGMQFNLKTAAQHFEAKNFPWILYFSHDCFPKGDGFFTKLDTYLNTKDLSEFGVVGFNILHTREDIADYDGDNTPLRNTARTPLEPGDMYYRHHGYWPNTRVRYDEKFNKPFAVEIIMWTAGLLNIAKFNEHVEPTGEYHMFHSWDDMCFQFLKNNVYNIVLPKFCMAHDQSKKVSFGIPESSPNCDIQTRQHFYSKSNHLEVWKKRWGFSWDYPQSLIEFKKIEDRYTDTLIMDFSKHDPINGPLKTFDL